MTHNPPVRGSRLPDKIARRQSFLAARYFSPLTTSLATAGAHFAGDPSPNCTLIQKTNHINTSTYTRGAGESSDRKNRTAALAGEPNIDPSRAIRAYCGRAAPCSIVRRKKGGSLRSIGKQLGKRYSAQSRSGRRREGATHLLAVCARGVYGRARES